MEKFEELFNKIEKGDNLLLRALTTKQIENPFVLSPKIRKKFFLELLRSKVLIPGLFLLLSAIAKGQGRPVLPYKEASTEQRAAYSKEELKKFLSQPSKLAKEVRELLVEKTNKELKKSGIDLLLSEASVFWIINHTKDSTVVLKNFLNTRVIEGKKLERFFDKRTYTGLVKVFEYKDPKTGRECRFMVAKSVCFNPINELNSTSSKITNKEPEEPEEKSAEKKIKKSKRIEVIPKCNCWEKHVYSYVWYPRSKRFLPARDFHSILGVYRLKRKPVGGWDSSSAQRIVWKQVLCDNK